MKRIKLKLTEKQIFTILRMIQQEFHFENSAAEIKHLEGLQKKFRKAIK